MNKESIRALYKEKRKSLSSTEKMKLDDLLLIQFQQLNFEGVHRILTYWPIEHQIEPNTHLFSRYLQYMIPDLSIAYPKINKLNLMDAVLVNEQTTYSNVQWGITEPLNGTVIAPSSIDLILVPLLAFDLKGNRVGYGKGYYDRFLTTCKKEVILIGISYFEPIPFISDTHQFDIPLTIGITQQHIYEF